MRARLRSYTDSLWNQDKTVVHASNEIEGFLFRGRDAERRYFEAGKFEFISTGGYYHSLPGDELRRFIDTSAEVQRAMGFANEKDHPEVAPSQFEMNYSYTEANVAADQVLLYKLICRQVAQKLEMTASFLPKPVTGVNGNGMHLNMSLARGGKNLFYDAKGEDSLSKRGWDMIERILTSGQELCLMLNPSVNAYRRLDPHFEAPNQIKASAINRGAMIRIPWGNERSERIEVRSIAPDANPHMAIYALLRTGLEGPLPPEEENGENKRARTRFLPDNIHDAIRIFKASPFIAECLGEEAHRKFAEAKQASADRCPKALGSVIKTAEVQFHHEVTNQYLWSMF
jgi:glutamine synthetase